ncbi:helix-turn-helix transcriptional regulator [Phototrophicus methaneseepsis]|uniref:Helix-turn-helix transcriptional regulator n=1 Tax=Phototrophicus methaneseepsis TaxID=2710758 RepID=A0A7S8EB67_9CHLR|nr:helix-turn-helix transcriptional regulator [Phototrophicus methaneseepsis]QPC83751.1 helix-turn-helix transcriptional regulator [Phototrophicus methaneseepsis]
MVDSEQEQYAVYSLLSDYMSKKSREVGHTITRDEVHQATGIDPSTLSRYRSPEPFKKIDVSIAMKLAEFFECEWWELFQKANS